ncbi:MAG: hypothetical protein INR71_09635 [Terriglobus roseus]|nr:hypothetical protein [Terriglobus roseus]
MLPRGDLSKYCGPFPDFLPRPITAAMQELLLFGQVPAARHEQVLKILAGATAMQPQAVLERHAVYRPAQAPRAAVQQVGGSQDIQQQKTQKQRQSQSTELFYLQLVQDLYRDAAAPANGELDAQWTDRDGSWSMQYHDVPLPGQKSVLQRQISRIDVVEGSPHQFMASQGYKSVTPCPSTFFCKC